MNNLSIATLTVIVTALSEKVEGLTLVNEAMAGVVKEQDAHIQRDHAYMDEQQRTITDLRTRLESTYDLSDENARLRDRNLHMSYKVEDFDRMKAQSDRMYEQVRQLQTELHKLKYGGETPEETANAYMAKEGAAVWAGGNKIGAIKVCREVSGWGLKETKDFCEAYMDRHKAMKEEAPSGTKRSSQLPAGVGVAKSA